MSNALATGVRACGRHLLLGALAVVLRRAPSPPPSIESKRLRKVLLVRIDSRVGNVLLTTPLLRALREGLPEARVDFLVAGGKAPLVEGLADRVLVFQKRDLFRAPLRFWRAIRALRRERYDAVVEAGHWSAFSFTSNALARVTGAPIRVGHERGPTERFLTHPVLHDPAHVRDVEAKLELLAPFDLPPRGEGLETTVDPPAARAEAALLIAELRRASGCGGPLVVLNPGSRKLDSRWPAEGFAALARALRGADMLPVIAWGPGEEPLARIVAEESGGSARLAPPTTLAQLAALFRVSDVVVTNDTGPMHLAVAVGAPVVATLTREDGPRWSHAGTGFTGVAVSGAGPEMVARVLEAVKRALSDAMLTSV